MQSSTKRVASTAGLAAVFVLAAGGLALAVEQYVHPQGDARNTLRDAAAACATCASAQAAEFRWEIANDAKMAEPMPTF
jgi:hypothetical protein